MTTDLINLYQQQSSPTPQIANVVGQSQQWLTDQYGATPANFMAHQAEAANMEPAKHGLVGRLLSDLGIH